MSISNSNSILITTDYCYTICRNEYMRKIKFRPNYLTTTWFPHGDHQNVVTYPVCTRSMRRQACVSDRNRCQSWLVLGVTQVVSGITGAGWRVVGTALARQAQWPFSS